MKSAGAKVEIYRYEAAHAFFNEESATHHAESAAASWQRTLEFLRFKL